MSGKRPAIISNACAITPLSLYGAAIMKWMKADATGAGKNLLQTFNRPGYGKITARFFIPSCPNLWQNMIPNVFTGPLPPNLDAAITAA